MTRDYSLTLTRREFVGQLAIAGASLGALSLISAQETNAAAAACRTAHDPVVSFFMDRPYVDYTGTAVPYHPPRGACSAAPVAHLSDAEFHALLCCA